MGYTTWHGQRRHGTWLSLDAFHPGPDGLTSITGEVIPWLLNTQDPTRDTLVELLDSVLETGTRVELQEALAGRTMSESLTSKMGRCVQMFLSRMFCFQTDRPWRANMKDFDDAAAQEAGANGVGHKTTEDLKSFISAVVTSYRALPLLQVSIAMPTKSIASRRFSTPVGTSAGRFSLLYPLTS